MPDDELLQLIGTAVEIRGCKKTDTTVTRQNHPEERK
jgi:hypothetical protein